MTAGGRSGSSSLPQPTLAPVVWVQRMRRNPTQPVAARSAQAPVWHRRRGGARNHQAVIHLRSTGPLLAGVRVDVGACGPIVVDA